MVGMMLAKLIDKNRLSDKDREFYLKQMPNLRQADDEIALKSAQEVSSVLAQKFNIDLDAHLEKMNQGSVEPIGDTELAEILEKGYVLIKDPDTQEIKQFNDISMEDLNDAIDQGYILIE